MSQPHDHDSLPLLNVYEIEEDGRARHLVGFMDSVLAGSIGLSSHAMVGEFSPGPDGQFDPATFVPNQEFIEALTLFLNVQPEHSPQLQAGAREAPGQPLYVVDPRCPAGDDEDPELEDVLGTFDVDDEGTVVPNSFTYNERHRWFSTRTGVSGLLQDRDFYEFLHPEARRPS